MPRVVIEPHAHRRMRERDISNEEIADVWLRFERERPSQRHPGFVVRTGRTAAGRIVTVVGLQTAAEFRVKTVW